MVPEAKLLLLLARAVVGPLDGSRGLRAAEQCQSPELFVHWCRAAKMWPMVSQPLAILSSRSRHPFLRESLHSLQHSTRTIIARQAKRLEVGFTVLDGLFENSEIPHIYLRGIPFARCYYPAGVHRYCEDIDVLIPGTDLTTAAKALLEAGYVFGEVAEKRHARAGYMGQCEFRNKDGLPMLDLNWRLSGNCGIGPVDRDVTLIWQRSEQVSEFQYRMSDEDALIELLRHTIHGHDLVQGVLRSCVDLDALLSKSSYLDWTYVRRQIEHAEMRRGCCFLGWFYSEIYQSVYSEVISKHLPTKSGRVAGNENKLFAHWVIIPGMMPSPDRKALSEYKKLQRAMLAKAWAMDKFSRLIRVLRIPFFPSKEEVVLLGDLNAMGHVVKARFAARMRMLLVVPGFLFGLSLRVLLGTMAPVRGTVAE